MYSMDSISSLANQIAAEFHPDKIILFGSYAYGAPSEDSDVDLLVVLPFEGKGVYKSVEILSKINPAFPLDLIVRTPEQIETRLKLNDFFLREVVEKGKVLYEASH